MQWKVTVRFVAGVRPDKLWSLLFNGYQGKSDQSVHLTITLKECAQVVKLYLYLSIN
jgi:hypothetical protein